MFKEGDTQQSSTDKPMALEFQIKLEFRNIGCEEEREPENAENNPRSKGENQQQTQPTYDAGSRNRTRDTLVGGERSHHCATPAPPTSVLGLEIAMNI